MSIFRVSAVAGSAIGRREAGVTTEFEAVIGLEVHAQLKTKTKIFCSCSTQFGNAPNTNTCPVCLGMPGTLPVLNRQVVNFAIRTALATAGALAPTSVFARKNYFYPDLPKGYQISQYELPISLGGFLEIEIDNEPRRVGLTRIHMEEDAGKNIHEAGADYSLVDFNRAGVPLLEIVSEPDLRSPEEAGAYMRALRTLLVYLDVCDGNMEEGSLRCDANVSVRPKGSAPLGNKVEIKNLNSFRFVEKGIAYEIKRQTDLIKSGGPVVQETRLYDSDEGKTYSMRSKEEAHDYRYFPDPDLLPLTLDRQQIDEIRVTLPELPAAKIERFVRQYQLSRYDANSLVQTKAMADYMEAVVRNGVLPKTAANWVLNQLSAILNVSQQSIETTPVTPEKLVLLIRLIDNGTINQNTAKTVLEEMARTGSDPQTIVSGKGLAQVSDEGAIAAMIDQVIAANPQQLADYRSGKDKLFGYFMGQVMRELKGQGNPKTLKDLLTTKLKG